MLRLLFELNPAGTNAGASSALVGTHKMDNTVTNMAVDTGGHLTLEESFTQDVNSGCEF